METPQSPVQPTHPHSCLAWAIGLGILAVGAGILVSQCDSDYAPGDYQYEENLPEGFSAEELGR